MSKVDITVDIKLKDGRLYANKDIPERMFGDCDRFVSCWVDDITVIAFPLKEVEYFKLNFKGKGEQL